MRRALRHGPVLDSSAWPWIDAYPASATLSSTPAQPLANMPPPFCNCGGMSLRTARDQWLNQSYRKV